MASIASVLVTLRVVGGKPDEIAVALGCAPDEVHAKRGPAQQPAWQIRSRLDQTAPLEAQIYDVFSRTTSDLDVWRRLANRFEIDLFCGLFLESSNEGLELSPGVLSLLAERGVILGLDVYGPSAPNEHENDVAPK